jgi:hypothetical protein
MTTRTIGKFHRSRLGYFLFGLVELALGLVFANLAIPSGDWWEWLLAFICFFGFVQNFGRMIVGAKR